MLSFSIRSRLILLFTLQIVLIFLAGGVYLDWNLRQTIETELSDKLETLARAAALQIDGDLLLNLAPGDEDSRTYRNLKTQLQQFKAETDVRRIFLLDRACTSLVDTRSGIPIGNEYVFLPITPGELQTVFSGQTISSPLFTGHDQRLYKTGFAPVVFNGEVVAVLALEGSADTLEAIRAVRRDLMLLGIAVLLGSVFLGALFSKTLTRPINRLKMAAQKIAKGDYESQIATDSEDEIGFLGQTMEEMRKAIVQRDTRQKAMLAGVAHEIRNPLGGIELFAGLLVSELEDEKARGEAMKIQKEVQNLKKIVTDFLSYARPNPPKKEVCDIGKIFEEAVALMHAKLERVTIRAHCNDRARVDPWHLKQVFLNLIDNSVEAMNGTGEISIKTREVKKAVKITFTDTGPGIPEAIRDNIFQPFFTVRKNGTGLGLAIAKSLLEENGGEIHLSDHDIAHGAAFEITLQAQTL